MLNTHWKPFQSGAKTLSYLNLGGAAFFTLLKVKLLETHSAILIKCDSSLSK